jgi:hypothetical protein
MEFDIEKVEALDYEAIKEQLCLIFKEEKDVVAFVNFMQNIQKFANLSADKRHMSLINLAYFRSQIQLYEKKIQALLDKKKNEQIRAAIKKAKGCGEKIPENVITYYSEDTDSSIFNGDEVLWNFVRDALADELTPWYSKLEESLLTDDSVLPYFNNNQANMANEAFYNGDASYKYINPARDGYWDYLNKKPIAPGEGPYLYAAQGDRSLMREWFLSNRMRFLRGKYNSKNY